MLAHNLWYHAEVLSSCISMVERNNFWILLLIDIYRDSWLIRETEKEQKKSTESWKLISKAADAISRFTSVQTFLSRLELNSTSVISNFDSSRLRLFRSSITYQQLKVGNKAVDIVDEVVKFLHKAIPFKNFIVLYPFKEIDECVKFFYHLLEKSWFLTKQTNTKIQY